MSSRTRAILFAAGALGCATLSAALAGGASEPAGAFGELRPVVVAVAPLDKGVEVGRAVSRSALDERRVPAEFAPPDALTAPAEALGRRLATSLPPGSYLTAAHLAATAAPGRRRSPRGTTPVSIRVTGAAALAASRRGHPALVDVVVTGEPGPGPGLGRTRVAARGVPLLGLERARAETGLAGDAWQATLALTRPQALTLIRAEAAGGSIRLLAR